VVDGNVERVLCRLLDLQISPDEPGLKREFKQLAQTFLDPSRPGDFNQALMELGQLCCTVTSPSCHVCPLAKNCLSNARSTQDLCPKPKARRPATKVEMRLGIVCHRNKVALVERPVQAKFLGKSWGFLTGLATKGDLYCWDGGPTSSPIHKALRSAKPFAKKVKHSITHHQIQAQVVALDPGDLASVPTVRWVPLAKVDEALVSNLDRKAWKLFRAKARTIEARE
jgi:A/G-specific adenine glycosylase